MSVNLFSSKPTPSLLSITSKITSNTLEQNILIYVIISFELPVPTATLLYNMFLQLLKLPTSSLNLSELQSTLKRSKCLISFLSLQCQNRNDLQSLTFSKCNSIFNFKGTFKTLKKKGKKHVGNYIGHNPTTSYIYLR